MPSASPEGFNKAGNRHVILNEQEGKRDLPPRSFLKHTAVI